VLTINEGLIVSAGTMDIVTGTVIAIGTFDNAGTILDTGTLALFGHYDTASLERIGGSSGTLLLADTLANAGGAFDGAGPSQLTILGLGTAQGGTVVGIANPGGGSLDGVAWPRWTSSSITSIS
jgi:hypothetical protein